MKKHTVQFTWVQGVIFAVMFGVGTAVGNFLWERIVG